MWDLDRRPHEQRHALCDGALAVARSAEDEQRGARHHRAPDLVDDVLLQLELAKRLLQLRVGDWRLAAHLRADQREIVLEVDRAGAEVPGLDRRHLSRPLAAGTGDRVVHLDRVWTALQPGVVGHAAGVHQLVLLELVDQGGEGLERQAQALLERGAGQLVGKGKRPQQQARDQVTTDVQVFKTLGSLDRPGYHRAHILHSRTHVPTAIGRGS